MSIRVLGKGRRERALPLWKTTAVALRAWLAIRGRVAAPEVFVNARGEPLSRWGFAVDVSRAVSADDRTIRERLTADLKAQPWAPMLTKNIVVENGVVHLFGFVRSEEERRALRIASENVPGVIKVEDHLMRREPGGI